MQQIRSADADGYGRGRARRVKSDREGDERLKEDWVLMEHLPPLSSCMHTGALPGRGTGQF